MNGGFFTSPSASSKSSSKSVMRATDASVSRRPRPSNSACRKCPVSGAAEIMEAVPQSCTNHSRWSAAAGALSRDTLLCLAACPGWAGRALKGLYLA